MIGGDSGTSEYEQYAIVPATYLAWGRGTNEKLLAYSSYNDKTIIIWDMVKSTTTSIAATADTHGTDVSTGMNTFAWSPDGNSIAFPTSVGVQIWDIAQRKVSKQIEFSTGQTHTKEAVTSLSWSSDGNFIAVGVATKNETMIIDVLQGQVHKRLTNVGGIAAIWSPDGTALATISDQVVTVSFTLEGYISTSYTFPNDVTALAWSYDSRYLVAASQGSSASVYMWNVFQKDGTPVSGRLIDGSTPNKLIDTHGTPIHSLAWSFAGGRQYLAIGADKAYLLEIDPAMLNNQGQQGFNYHSARRRHYGVLRNSLSTFICY